MSEDQANRNAHLDPMIEALRRAWRAAPPAPDLRSVLWTLEPTRNMPIPGNQPGPSSLDPRARPRGECTSSPLLGVPLGLEPTLLAALVREDALERRRRGLAWGLAHYQSLFPAECLPGSPVAELLVGLECGLGDGDVDALRKLLGHDVVRAIAAQRGQCHPRNEPPAEPDAPSSGSWIELSAEAGPDLGTAGAASPAAPIAAHSNEHSSRASGSAGDRAAASLLVAPRKGQRVGAYVLRRRLGDGGFGEVWMADRRTPDMTVAVKLLLPGRDMPAQRARFEAEAQALARLSHECIARIIDFSAGTPERESRAVGEGDARPPAGGTVQTPSGPRDGVDLPHLVMEFIEGEPITAYCDRRRLSLAQRLELVARVADAIHHAHSRQLIHRDLKPANILVTEFRSDPDALRGRDRLLVVDREGNQVVVARPKIVDFGLVKSLDANVRLADGSLSADFGKLMGTLEYMAPEQVHHDPLGVDTRADIFALGVVLYELAAGVRPISSEELRREAIDAAIAKVRNMPRPEASTRFSSLDRETAMATALRRGESSPERLTRLLGGRLRHLAGTALRMEKERRFSSAAAFARDIRRYLDNEPFEEAAAEPLSRTLWLAIRRRPLPYAAAAAVSLTVLAALVAVTLLGRSNAALALRERAAARSAESQLERAEASAVAEEAARALAETRAQEARRERNVARDRALVATAWIEAPEDPALRAMILREIASSPGDWIVDRAIIGAAREGAPRIVRLWHDDAVRSLAWSPDGSQLATVTVAGQGRLWPLERPDQPVLLEPIGELGSLAWSPDGKRFAANDAGVALVWRIDQANSPAVLAHEITLAPVRPIVAVGWSADGSQLVTGSGGGIDLWRDGAREALVQFEATGTDAADVYNMTWSPDRSRVVTSSAKGGGLTVWQCGGTDDPKVLLRLPTLDGKVAWSPDGSRLAVLPRPRWRSPRAFATADRRGSHSAEFLGIEHALDSLSDGRVTVWQFGDAASAPRSSRLEAPALEHPARARGRSNFEADPRAGPPLLCMAWSADGSQIATGANDGRTYLWKGDLDEPPTVLPGHGSSVRSVAWSPQGSRLATASDDRTVRVWEVGSRSCLSVLRGHRGSVRAVAWSPDGTRLATASDDRTASIWQAEASDGPQLLLAPEQIDSWGLIAWNSDRSRLLQAIPGGVVRLWSTEPGVDPILLQSQGARVLAAAWSPDGERVAFAAIDGSTQVHSLDPEVAPLVMQGHNDWIRALAWSPDGTRVATASDDLTARIWSLHSRSEPVVLRGHEGWVRCLAWHPDGARIATGADDAAVRVYSASGTPEAAAPHLRLQGHEKPITAIAWSPDGLRIAAGSEDTTVRLFSMLEDVEPIVLRGHEGGVHAVAWRSDGKVIASASEDGTVRVWSVDSGLAPLILDAESLPLLSVAWRADGEAIVAQSSVGTILEWTLDVAACRAHLWSDSRDVLTPEERVRYLDEDRRDALANHARQRAGRDERIRASRPSDAEGGSR
jgi:WD40 repeat protein/serine/threonine protein kinase